MAVKFKGLSGNALKLIAAAAMVADHVGAVFFPAILDEGVYYVLRALGRLALPIFAFFIAEGCRYTKDRKKYFYMIFLLGIICDVAYYTVMKTVYFCVLTTFSVSVLLIYSYDGIVKSVREKDGNVFYNAVTLIAALCAGIFLQVFAKNNGGSLDYGVIGAILPLGVYAIKNRWLRLIPVALLTALMCLKPEYQSLAYPIQWCSLLTLPLLALYNGTRGRIKLKNFFYIFYPAHLVAVYGIYLLIIYLQ